MFKYNEVNFEFSKNVYNSRHSWLRKNSNSFNSVFAVWTGLKNEKSKCPISYLMSYSRYQMSEGPVIRHTEASPMSCVILPHPKLSDTSLYHIILTSHKTFIMPYQSSFFLIDHISIDSSFEPIYNA